MPRTPAAARQPEFTTPPTYNANYFDVADTAPPDQHRYRRVADLIGDSVTLPGQAERLLLVPEEKPATFAEAEPHDCWRSAMLDELRAIEQNGTWSLVELPAGHRPIGLKWVYKVKKDAARAVIKHKARLVAKGYVQREGIDFDEVFAPVARLDSVRLLAATAVRQHWQLHHLDVKSAFLNGGLEEKVYVAQPPGFVQEGREHQVFHLHKALYRLRQAPRAWNAKLDTTLVQLGFRRSESEHAVYIRGTGDQRLLLGVYVDDLIITGASTTEIERFKLEMKSQFEMSDLGLLTFYTRA